MDVNRASRNNQGGFKSKNHEANPESQLSSVESENPRSALRGCWSKVKDALKNIKRDSGEMLEEVSYLEDAADLGMSAANYGSEFGDWESSIESVERLYNTLENTHYDIQILRLSLKPVTDTSSGTAVMNSFSLVGPDLPSPGIAYQYGLTPDHGMDQTKYGVWHGYIDLFNRNNLKDKVLELMTKCGFQQRNLGRKAIQRFENAWAFFIQSPPVDDPTLGSLISMRVAIKLTIDTLSQLKPTQTKGINRVKDIGIQLSAESVDPRIIDELQDEYEKFQDIFSKSKESSLGRIHETTMMQKGTLFLQTLLSSIDLEKIAKSQKPKKKKHQKAE